MRRGVRLGVDVGAVRVGLARSDPDGLVATALETVPRGPGDLVRLREVVGELGVVEVVVGLPRSLAGGEGAAAGQARGFASALAGVLADSGMDVPVRLHDERLSTVSAEASLRAGGGRAGGRGRQAGRRRRAVVDQVAAAVILQAAMDGERVTGQPGGEPVEPGWRAGEGDGGVG